MQKTFELTRICRNNLLSFLDSYSLQQLNTVPHGYSNNLIWNIAHVIVTQQMIVNLRSGLPMLVSQEMLDKYKRGTRPEHDVTQQEVDQIKSLLFTTIEQTEQDFANGIFKDYEPFTSSSGFEMRSASDAILFNVYHEATHTGIMMGIRRFV